MPTARKRGRPRAADPTQRMRNGVLFVSRIPRPLHGRIKLAAKSQGITLGRWMVEQAAAAIGAEIEAPREAPPKKKSAA